MASGARVPLVSSDVVLHPVVLVSLVVLVVNDHYWKGIGPGWLTGKLSDIAGLIVLSVAVVGVCNMFATSQRESAANRRRVAIVVGAVAVAYTSVKSSGWVADRYSNGLTTLHAWSPIGLPGQLMVRADPTDLVALPALFVAWRVCCAPAARRSMTTTRLSPRA